MEAIFRSLATTRSLFLSLRLCLLRTLKRVFIALRWLKSDLNFSEQHGPGPTFELKSMGFDVELRPGQPFNGPRLVHSASVFLLI